MLAYLFPPHFRRVCVPIFTSMPTFSLLVAFHLAMAAWHTTLTAIVVYVCVTRRCFPLPSGDCDTVYI